MQSEEKEGHFEDLFRTEMIILGVVEVFNIFFNKFWGSFLCV